MYIDVCSSAKTIPVQSALLFSVSLGNMSKISMCRNMTAHRQRKHQQFSGIECKITREWHRHCPTVFSHLLYFLLHKLCDPPLFLTNAVAVFSILILCMSRQEMPLSSAFNGQGKDLLVMPLELACLNRLSRPGAVPLGPQMVHPSVQLSLAPSWMVRCLERAPAHPPTAKDGGGGSRQELEKDMDCRASRLTSSSRARARERERARSGRLRAPTGMVRCYPVPAIHM